MTRFVFLFALSVLVAVGGCDTQNGTGGEEEEEEQAGPISIEYRVDAPSDIIKFVIQYTNAEGETETQLVEQPFAFPFVPEVFELPFDAAGTFSVSITGTIPSGQGAVRTSVIARQDGSRIAEANGDDTATAADPAVAADASITLPVASGN